MRCMHAHDQDSWMSLVAFVRLVTNAMLIAIWKPETYTITPLAIKKNYKV